MALTICAAQAVGSANTVAPSTRAAGTSAAARGSLHRALPCAISGLRHSQRRIAWKRTDGLVQPLDGGIVVTAMPRRLRRYRVRC